jgi:hypothetical protein
MTFREFCEEISGAVLSAVPAAKYIVPRQPADPATISLGGATATITRESVGWRVAFTRPGGGVSMSSPAGENADARIAANLASSIAGFLT